MKNRLQAQTTIVTSLAENGTWTDFGGLDYENVIPAAKNWKTKQNSVVCALEERPALMQSMTEWVSMCWTFNDTVRQ